MRSGGEAKSQQHVVVVQEGFNYDLQTAVACMFVFAFAIHELPRQASLCRLEEAGFEGGRCHSIIH